MGFEALIEKVRQAETALEARERLATADWRQVKASWRAAWTPGRIVLAGLVGGFLFGRAAPLKRSGAGMVQLASVLGSLFAGGSAQAAASEASEAADSAQRASGEGPPDARAPAPPANDEHLVPPYEVPETFRGSGHL